MLWFTSDTHFGHQAILAHCGRPWDTVGEMSRALVSSLNAFVAPTDDLYDRHTVLYDHVVELGQGVWPDPRTSPRGGATDDDRPHGHS